MNVVFFPDGTIAARRRISTAVIGAIALLASCASVDPPNAQLAAARAAITDAESAGAAQRAQSELAAARDKLARAESRARIGYRNEARLLAEEAAADAQLAAMKARAANAEITLTTVRSGAADEAPVPGRSP
jgi:Domain of unknown function (DUF4398)